MKKYGLYPGDTLFGSRMGSYVVREHQKLGIVGGIGYTRSLEDDMRREMVKDDPHKLIRRLKWVKPYGL